MSATTIKSAISKAVSAPANRAPSISRDEARAIVAAAEKDRSGGVVVSKAEAELIAKLTSGARNAPPLTDAARRELDAFFNRHALPFGGNADRLRGRLDQA
ncbi:MAG: hypothetical protein ACK4N5_15990, partial [Myxococcales bacterium]